MLGLEDTSIWIGYILCIASTLLCLGYGAANWNRGSETASQEDLRWVEKEKEDEKEL